MPTDRWYGSENIVDRWLPDVLAELNYKNGSKGKGPFEFADLKDYVSNVFGGQAKDKKASTR